MSNEQKRIDILMATYQGGSFLKAQIASILKQSYKNWRLIIRDDGSTDATRDILASYSYSPRITVLPADARLGIIGNFSTLLSESTAEYVMFSDQDDIWFADKVQKTLEHMQSVESQYGSKTPILVHTDLKVVDKNLAQIHPSFWRFVNLNAENRTSLNQLLVQNAVTGCTMMLNRSLVELSKPIPDGVCMHDWWIALTAAAFGRVEPLSAATIAYRQHGNNSVGAKAYSLINGLKKIVNNFGVPKEKDLRVKRAVQAKMLLERHRSRLDAKTIELLESYQEYCAGSMFTKAKIMRKHDIYKHGFLRNVYELLS